MIPQRPLFWGIQGAWVFYLLAAVAAGVFLYGVWAKAVPWGRDGGLARFRPTRRDLVRLIVDGLLGRRILRGDLAAGLMHALIFVGFLGLLAATILAGVDHYLVSFLRGDVYLVYSVCADAAGVLFVVGLGWALVRRYVERVPRLQNRAGDLGLLLSLLGVAVTGFLVEGIRLSIESPGWATWSPAGRGLSLVLPGALGSSTAYVAVWWVHAVGSLALIAAIPYSKLFHALAGPANVALAERDAAAVSLDACMHCGRCAEVCPSTGAGEPFSPREIVAGLRARSSPEAAPVWHCTACGACSIACPVYVAPPELIRRMRRTLLEDGTRVPSHLARTLELLYKYDNPWEASKKKRGAWAEPLDVPGVDGDGRVCYFVGCTTSLDTRAQKLARSFVEILRRADVPFGTLGKKEPCCGEIARRLGEHGLYEEQRGRCAERFERHGIRSVVTSSPHCYDTLRNEGGRPGLEARHYSQLLAELVRDGSLRFERPLRSRVTYHDPCYLGRHNGVYDDPRQVIRAIPGIELVEMAHHGSDGLCCGGGGGRMWQEGLDAQVKMSEVRIREAAATGAEIVVSACPLCLIMLDDARKTADLEHTLEVMDLNELVAAALGGAR